MGSDAANKAKLNLKLAVNRIKLNRKKNEALVAQDKRNLADLLAQKKEESARIRVCYLYTYILHRPKQYYGQYLKVKDARF